MEKDFLIECIKKGMSSSEISILVGKSKTTIKYWLDKFELKTNHKTIRERKPIEYGDTKYCPRCETNKVISEFYNKRNKIGGSGYCKQCTSEESGERAKKLKQQCVEYMGGSCVKCGYNKCNAALQFHHLEPTKKDFSISNLRTNSFNDKIKNELDKCILLCSNCHFETHSNIN